MQFCGIVIVEVNSAKFVPAIVIEPMSSIEVLRQTWSEGLSHSDTNAMIDLERNGLVR
jgi:hypothetical protein